MVRLGANVAKSLKLVRRYKIFRVFLAVGLIFKIRMAAKSLQPQWDWQFFVFKLLGVDFAKQKHFFTGRSAFCSEFFGLSNSLMEI